MDDAHRMQDVRLLCFIRWLDRNLWQLEFQVPRRANTDWMHIGNRLFSNSQKRFRITFVLMDFLVVYASVKGAAFVLVRVLRGEWHIIALFHLRRRQMLFSLLVISLLNS